jgi:hypothetical protein
MAPKRKKEEKKTSWSQLIVPIERRKKKLADAP